MNSKAPSKQDQLAESIKLSLDAAEAAMDITTEFSEVQTKFKVAADKTDKIYRLSMIGVFGSVIISFVALLIVAGLFWRTTADLNVVTQSNLKLLKVFTEKINEFQKSNQFEKLTSQADAIKGNMETISGKMETALEAVDTVASELSTIKNQLNETQESLKAANGKMTEMTLAKIETLKSGQRKVEKALKSIARFNKKSVSSTSKLNTQVRRITKKLKEFNSEFKKEVANMKKLQKTTVNENSNQIKFSR